jgi:hypothetical protein
MFVWASNLTWVLFIINLPLFKEEFASANRNWSLAISMYAIIFGLPLFSMALLWADIDHPPLTRMGLELVPRLMTTCSVIVSLEAFWTNPSKGWLANDAALFGRGLYVAAVLTGCAFSLLLVYVRDPGTPQPEVQAQMADQDGTPQPEVLRGPMADQAGLNRGDIDLRIIDTLNRSTLTALVLLLSIP